jgi:hypothetical protein
MGIPAILLQNAHYSPEELRAVGDGVRVVRDWAELGALLLGE